MSEQLAPVALVPVALAKRELVLRAVADGRRIGLQFGNAVDDTGKRMKAAGASWLAPRRMWVLREEPPERVADLLERAFADAAHLVELADLRRLLAAATAAPQPAYFAELLDVQLFPLGKGGFAVSFAYDLPMVEAMRELGGRFHKFAGAWEMHRSSDHILQVLRERAGVQAEFVFVHERPVVLEALSASSKSASPIQVPAASPEWGGGGTGEDKGLQGNGFMTTEVSAIRTLDVDEAQLAAVAAGAGLRDYQVTGSRFLLARSGALLADDMGLGKSRQAVVASRLAAGTGRVLLVCPASLRINWEREILAVFPNARVGMVGEDRMAMLYGCDWVIANYERLGGLVREPEMAFEVMAIDEAHYLKEHEAGRTRNAFILAERIPRRFALTGTPLLSREVEMHTLLRLTGHPLGKMELKDFRKSFAGNVERRAALADQIRSWMLRRKKDVLTDLGTKSYSVRHVSPAEGLDGYNAILKDMSLMVMPKITKLRQCLEMLKFEFIIETVQALGQDDKIIVFAEYMDTVGALRAELSLLGIGAVSLVGSDSLKKRQAAVDAFQTDPAIKVFIGTTSAAGVGITLTAANYVTFASLPWTNALKRQSEDRAYRLGQRRDVFVIVPLIPKTIDEQVHQLLLNKAEIESGVVDAVQAALQVD